MSEQYGKHASAFHEGTADAMNNLGCHASDYPAKRQKAYRNGYNFGQQLRAANKRATKPSKRG